MDHLLIVYTIINIKTISLHKIRLDRVFICFNYSNEINTYLFFFVRGQTFAFKVVKNIDAAVALRKYNTGFSVLQST